MSSNRDRAFDAQNNEEFIEITETGEVRPVNPQTGPRGAALRDPKGEYQVSSLKSIAFS